MPISATTHALSALSQLLARALILVSQLFPWSVAGQLEIGQELLKGGISAAAKLLICQSRAVAAADTACRPV